MCFLNQFEKTSLFGQLTPENEMKCDTQETLLWWQQKGEPQFIPPELSPEDRHAEHERSPWIKITLITAPLTMSCQEEGILFNDGMETRSKDQEKCRERDAKRKRSLTTPCPGRRSQVTQSTTQEEPATKKKEAEQDPLLT